MYFDVLATRNFSLHIVSCPLMTKRLNRFFRSSRFWRCWDGTMSYRLAILASPSPAFVHSAAPGAKMAGQSLTRNSVTATYILAATGRNGCKVHASTLQHLMVKLNGPNGIPLRYGFWNYKYNTVSLKCRWLYMQLSHTFARCYILISGCGIFMPLCRLHECIDVLLISILEHKNPMDSSCSRPSCLLCWWSRLPAE